MSACVICGSPACDLHHPTGRDGDGHHLDPDLLVPVCHDDHEQLHDDWRTQQLESAPAGLSTVERLEYRLRRAAVIVARLFEWNPSWSWARALARTLVSWADELAAELKARDLRDPDWRSDPSFYPQVGMARG